jgi:thiamine pyrophosphate-dependent acetolactate synthase large subunit-like protein
MGAMATVGQHAPRNFRHIIINNGAHDSVGGQPTDAGNHTKFDFGSIAKGCGYKEVGFQIFLLLTLGLKLGDQFNKCKTKQHL